MDGNWINCCTLALIALIGNIIQLCFFFNYNLKLKDKSIKLEKNDHEHEKKHAYNEARIKELEKKNGKELNEIKKLKGDIRLIKAMMTLSEEARQNEKQEPEDEEESDDEWDDD